MTAKKIPAEHLVRGRRFSAIAAGACISLWLLMASCSRTDEEAAFLAQERADAVTAFEAAVRKQDWQQAAAKADAIIAKYPDSEDAKRISVELPAIREKRESVRVAGLWGYDEFSVTGGVQRSAAIYAKDDLDVDGRGPSPVRLIFRDHPSWGRSSYLVLQGGDFDCYGGCKVAVTIDAKPPKAMAASRPKTDEAIAMFIEDERALWRMIDGAKIVSVEFPTKGMGKRNAVFEVGGLDRARMPGWD